MKYFFFSFLLIFTYSNSLCQQINLNVLKKDSIIVEYKKVLNELKNSSLNRKYAFPKDPDLQKKFMANPTKEGMAKVLKDGGMINADEYVEKLFMQTSLMFQFLKKHPEIGKLEQQKRMQIIGYLIEN